MDKMDSISVLVFASNIDRKGKVDRVCNELLKIRGIYSVSVDLEDWENILRVECISESLSKAIQEAMSDLGVKCSELLE